MNVVAVLFLLTGCLGRADDVAPLVAELRPNVLAELPHDSSAYTEGLELDGDVLWSPRNAGQSQLRQLDPDQWHGPPGGFVAHDYFGEGITVVNDRIWEVTYRTTTSPSSGTKPR